MAPRKASLHLMALYGRQTWDDITSEQIDRLEQSLRDFPVIGTEPNRHTITNITRVRDVVAGFLVVEYEREAAQYDANKQHSLISQSEWEGTLFVIFPRLGVVLFQSRHYNKPLSESRVRYLFTTAIPEVLRSAELGFITLADFEQQAVSNQQFLSTFEDPNNRIERLVVENLRENPSLEGLTYYNPRIEWNRIVGNRLSNDYDKLDSITLDVGDKGTDLKNVNIAKSAIRSGTNEEMRYIDSSGQKRTLRRNIKERYEISLDLEGDSISEEDLTKIIEQVFEQYGIQTEGAPVIQRVDRREDQLPLLSYLGDEDDRHENDNSAEASST